MVVKTALLPLSNRMRTEDLELLTEGDICACDFYVDGMETANLVVGGYQRGRILNVDHHAPTTEMARRISSTNLAIQRAAQLRPCDGLVVINHTDCDSVLSAGIMSGELEPLPEFGCAAISADHTGEANPIGDLLQGLASLRDYEASLENLQRLLSNHPITVRCQNGIDARRRGREVAAKAVESGRFVVDGPVAVGVLEQSIDSVFFPALLPTASVILMLSPFFGAAGRWHAKIRLGLAAPDGFTLHQLSWSKVDVGYGGRWNAGSNGRACGTAMLPPDYAALLRTAVAHQLVSPVQRTQRAP